MTTRDRAPAGAPCWIDLWTSDTARAAAFYGGLLGWTAEEPSAEFGGYFMFTLKGVPLAGGMGDMGDMKADNTWKVYLAGEDAAKIVAAAEGAGAQVISPVVPVADLGSQAVLVDPTGATVGTWQPGTFPGITVLDEPGTPCWFELHSRDYDKALDFYRSVFGWETRALPEGLRYSVMVNPGGDGELAGVLDASGFLPEGTPSYWTVYFTVTDCAAAIEQVQALAGSVVAEPQDTPYGRIATVADPMGAEFRLRTAPV